jgi:hypothetical protein
MKSFPFLSRRRARPSHAVAYNHEPVRPERELMTRTSSGFRIALLWHPQKDAVSIAVEDFDSGHALQFPIEGSRALDAFHHPFAYAP